MTRAFSVHDMDQRSDEWRTIRLGRLTASRAGDMLTVIKSGESAARRKLRVQLVLERITGKSAEREYQSAAMRYGVEREADARAAYEAITGRLLESSGFIAHTDLMAGCSLDGSFNDFEGLVEIKCPESHTHWEYLKTGKVPKDYFDQVTHSIWITGAQWCDWMSYDDAFPEDCRAKLVRIPRAAVDCAAYELCVRTFLNEIDREVEAFQAMRKAAA